MKKIDTYREKKILVLGLAKSGAAVANCLLQLGAKVIINDAKDLDNDEIAKSFSDKGIKVIGGHHPVELFDDEHFDYLFKNPGIPYDNPMVKRAIELNIPVLTEPELAYEISDAKMIGITGSNGKTTVTTLISMIINQEGKNKAYAVGNIGKSVLDAASVAAKDDYLVTELSSFQLEGTTQLKPYIAAIVDVYPTHLDYHKSMENYVNAKLKITKNQDENDYFVANFDQPDILEKERSVSEANLVSVSFDSKNENGSYVENDSIFYKGEKIIAIKDLSLPGKHNVQNAMFVIAVTKILGISNDAINKILTTFEGVKHRLQFVNNNLGLRIYNDSKATNMEATTVALNSFSDPIVLIAGGLDRGFVFDDLVELFKEHVKSIILYGQTKHLLEEAANKAGISDITIVDTLDEAVPVAVEKTNKDEILLFSPANASWDQFKTFEERGDVFIKNIRDLEKQK